MRTLKEIAREIRANWGKVSPYANEYLKAMEKLNSVNDRFYFDDGRSVVMYFLANAQGWRGDVAKRIKLELKSML